VPRANRHARGRFDVNYRDAAAKIAAGAIGRPFLVRAQTCDQNDPSGFFVRFAPTGGGIFLDMSVHDVDLARWLLGNPSPVRVFAAGTVAVHEGLGLAAMWTTALRYANSRMARLHVSMHRARWSMGTRR